MHKFLLLSFALLVGAGATVAGSPGLTAAERQGDGGVSAFYRPEGSVPGRPGTMMRTEPLEAGKLPPGAGRGLRILYSSTNGVGAAVPVAVSGVLLLPKGAPPKGGWPVLAWAHGTTGAADVCAPSWQGRTPRDQAYLDRWLKEGFAVVATDYQGLGTPGPHPYLLYKPEGYSVLDSVRAVLAHARGRLANRVLLSGFSQGTFAALGAGWLAPRYAPELDVRGVMALGVVGEFEPQPDPRHPPVPWTHTTPPAMGAAYVMTHLRGGIQAMYPALDVDTLVTEKGKGLARLSQTGCLKDMFVKARADGLSDKNTFSDEFWRYMAEKDKIARIPDARFAMPVFVGTGLADDEAGILPQYNAVAAMCDAGTNVTWERYPGLTHPGAVNASLPGSLPFARALLAGKKVKGNCAALTPVGPLQKPLAGVPFNE